MSVSGISSSSIYDYSNAQDNFQQFQQAFTQLGQDLQSGNLSAAQADFAILQKLRPQSDSTSSSQSNDPIAQAFNQLEKDLQSGNLTAAQQDYATIQKHLRNHAAQGRDNNESGSGANAISQSLDQLGQALQSGDLSSAQTAYSTLLQQFQQFAQNNGLQTGSSQSSSNSVSVNA